MEDLKKIAQENPKIEFEVLKQSGHPILRGEYVNGNEKVICVRNYEHSKITDKIKLLADSSGAKLKHYTKPVNSHNPSVRGIWSPLHVEEQYRYKI
jgi:large subunit ribosomal protein L43